MTDADAHANTDREIYRAPNGDSVHVTESGGIGINVGGLVIVNSPRDWHRLEERPASYAAGIEDAAKVAEREADVRDAIAVLFVDGSSTRSKARTLRAIAAAIRSLIPTKED